MDERPSVITNPTELARSAGFWDRAMLAAALLAVAYCWLEQYWLLLNVVIVPAALVALDVMTSELATDFPWGIGSVAAGIRSKLGLRRGHECLLVLGHYWRVRYWPVWRANCVAAYRSARRQTTAWRTMMNDSVRLRLWRACSWLSAIRCSLSVRRTK